MNSPNQIYALEHSSRTHHGFQVYAPCYPIACCPVNAVAVIPEFIRGTLLRDRDENVYVMAYGPCSLRHGDVCLELKTLYPFRNTVTVEIDCEKEFSLNLRVPSFARGYTLTVNGEDITAQDKNRFICVRRCWRKGDTVTVRFKAEVETVILKDDDYSKKHPIAIRYGALIFAYHIPENWIPHEGYPITPLPEGWHWYSIKPDFEKPDVKDGHEGIGLRKEKISWNIAIDECLSAADFEIEELEESGYAWESPLIQLHTHAYKAPHMFAPYPYTTHEPYGEYQAVRERIPLTLVPYGCTNLRITYFPKAKLERYKKQKS